MRITWDPLSFCENDISKDNANLDRKGQYTLKKRPLDLQSSTSRKKGRENYSTTNTCATFQKEERPRWQNLELWRMTPSP